MLTDTPLDRVALYAALSGTLIGILFSLAGLVTTISEDSVHFFPFFCILFGCWGILGFIEAAIYLPYRNEDPETANLFSIGKKTLLLHAVWFWGGLICSFVLYSIWHSQKMFESGSQSFSLANGLLFGQILLGVLPHFVAFGLYFKETSTSSSSKKKHKKKKKSKKSKSKTSEDDYDSADPDAAEKGEGAADDSHAGGDGLGDDGLDLEKQPLAGGEDDYAGEDPYSKDSTGLGGEGGGGGKPATHDNEYGDESDGAYDEPKKDQPGGSEASDSDTSLPASRGSSHAHAPGTIHVETHRRDPRVGRDMVTEQDWNPDKNRYENYSAGGQTSQAPIVPYTPPRYPPCSPPFPASTPSRPASPIYSYTPGSPTWTPVPPQRSYAAPNYPPQTPYSVAQQTPYSQYPSYAPPISPTYSSPPVSPVYSPYPTQSQYPPATPYSYGQSPYGYNQSPYYR